MCYLNYIKISLVFGLCVGFFLIGKGVNAGLLQSYIGNFTGFHSTSTLDRLVKSVSIGKLCYSTPGHRATSTFWITVKNGSTWIATSTIALQTDLDPYGLEENCLSGKTLDFITPFTIPAGDDYLFYINVDQDVLNYVSGSYGPSFPAHYINGVYVDYGNDDGVVGLVNSNYSDPDTVIIDIPDYQRNIQIGTANFSNDEDAYCQLGQDCYLNIYWGYDDVGSDVYLRLASSSTAIASTTLHDQALLRDKMKLDDQVSETHLYYCIDVIKNSNLVYQDCNISVYWSSKTLAEQLGIEPYDISTACDDVEEPEPISWSFWATNTVSQIWDTIRAGVQCGGNKVSYWTFHPKDDYVVEYLKRKRELGKSFPFNIISTISNYTSTTTATTTFKIYAGSLSNNSDHMITVLTSEQLDSQTGGLWNTKIYPIIQIIIYIITGLYFIHWFKDRTMTNNDNTIE